MSFVLPRTIVGGSVENVADLNSNLNAVAAVLNNGITAVDHVNPANVDGAASTASMRTLGYTASQALPGDTAAYLGVTGGGNTRRGTSMIATAETRANSTYGTLTTPDQVSNVVLPANGLIVVLYQATWQESAPIVARAAIFLGNNQLKNAGTVNAAPVTEEAVGVCNATGNIDRALSTNGYGLTSDPSNATAYTGDVTTGQAVAVQGGGGAGPVFIFAAAGTYDVSVRFKATSGSVTVKNRKLWVWTIGF